MFRSYLMFLKIITFGQFLNQELYSTSQIQWIQLTRDSSQYKCYVAINANKDPISLDLGIKRRPSGLHNLLTIKTGNSAAGNRVKLAYIIIYCRKSSLSIVFTN